MRSVLLLGLLAACGSSGKPAVGPANSAASSVAPSSLPPAYAAVFRPATQSFRGEIVTHEYSDTGPKQVKTPITVACTIDAVDEKRDYAVASLHCQPSGEEGFPDDPSGTLVGSAKGLYRIERTFDGDLSKLSDKERLLPAVPAKDRHEWPGSEEGFGEAIIVQPHAGGWCTTLASWGGDESGWTLCFHPDKGVVGGASYFAGGMSKDVVFGDAPSDAGS